MSNPSAMIYSFESLVRNLMDVGLIHISPQLKPCNNINHASFPQPVANSYDTLLFGGALKNCATGRIYEFTERFETCFAVLFLGEDFGYVALGPYLAERMSDERISTLLIKNNLPLNSQQRFIEFYQYLPMLGEDKIRPLFFCLSQACEKNISNSPISAVDLGCEPSLTPAHEDEKLQALVEAIEKRYAYENFILHHVIRGDFEALDSLFSSPFTLIRTPHRLRNEKNLLLTFNTLLRKSIEAAHIHPLYIDRISTRFAIQIEQLTSENSIMAFRREMLRAYCDLVKRQALSLYSPNVRSAINYIHLNLTTPLTLKAVAEKLRLNPTYLSTQFNREVGKSLPDYISQKRIQEGQNLIKTSPFSITQISTAVGFSDVNYFSRIFKRETGMTPSEYKKQHANEYRVAVEPSDYHAHLK